MSRRPTLIALVIVMGLVSPHALAESKGSVSASPPPPDPAALDRLLEHMVRSQLERCPGVEVKRRGGGFLAGRYGGPIVLVSAKASCAVLQEPGKKPEAIVSTRWSTASADGQDIAVLRRDFQVGAPECPRDLDTPGIRRQVEPSVSFLCKEAFVPLREPVPLADFFFPTLSPFGVVKAATNGELDALILERQGRTFELAGRLTCEATSNELEGPMLGMSEMRSLKLVADLVLREPATGVILGQWRQQVVQALGVSCGIAFRLKGNAPRIEKAQTLWEERFAQAFGGA